MARTKQNLRVYRSSDTILERVTETFTHRQDLPDGSVIYADPANKFWREWGCAWYGVPPKDWDATKAVESVKVFSYEYEADYS